MSSTLPYLFCNSTHFHQAKAVVGSIVLGRQEFSDFYRCAGFRCRCFRSGWQDTAGESASSREISPCSVCAAASKALSNILKRRLHRSSSLICSISGRTALTRKVTSIFLRLCRETLKNRVDCRVGSKIPGRKLFQLPVQSV